MGLREKIFEDMTAAMKAQNAARLSVLRMMKSAIRNKEIDSRKELDDPQTVQLLLSLIKQRKDSIEQFTKGGRQDLVDKESAEVKVIEEYLPKAVDPEEISIVVDEVIAESGVTSIKDMGKVMKACMARFAGRPVDGAKISELVKAKLT
jgi:uncharacterized protein